MAKRSGTIIRLGKAVGAVTVTDADRKTVSCKEGYRMHSGYTISTGQKSQAYFTLDGDSGVCLEESGQVEIRKDGKKLKIHIITGKLSEVEAVENVEYVRTATEVTGTRG